MEKFILFMAVTTTLSFNYRVSYGQVIEVPGNPVVIHYLTYSETGTPVTAIARSILQDNNNQFSSSTDVNFKNAQPSPYLAIIDPSADPSRKNIVVSFNKEHTKFVFYYSATDFNKGNFYEKNDPEYFYFLGWDNQQYKISAKKFRFE